MGKNEELDLDMEFDDTVTLTLDDGEEVECAVIAIYPVDGKDYIALLPLEGEAADTGEVYLYQYEEDEDGNPSLSNIEDDDEYENAADAFDELLDLQEFDELVDEDELDELEELEKLADEELEEFMDIVDAEDVEE